MLLIFLPSARSLSYSKSLSLGYTHEHAIGTTAAYRAIASASTGASTAMKYWPGFRIKPKTSGQPKQQTRIFV